MKKYSLILKLLAAIVLLAVQGNVAAMTVDYTYDALGRLTNVVYADGKQLNYSYDAAGNILQVTAISNTSCGDENVFITQKTYSSTANETCTATTQLIAGADVLISSGATVAYYAPQVVLKPGFRAALGSYFIAGTQAIAAKTMLAITAPNDNMGEGVNTVVSISESFRAEQVTLDSILASIAQQPPVINGITLDPQQLSGLDYDSEGLYWAFATTQAFVIEDQNGLSDIYLYNINSGNVVLISRTSDSLSGQGDSRYPVIDESGRYIAFQSQANNLVTDDKNMGSDIFVYVADNDALQRVSEVDDGQTKTEFFHPAIDGAGLTLLYEVQLDKANNHIQEYDTVTQENTVITENNSSNYYYPAISRDGRYQAYLVTDTNGESCTIHWSDKQSGTEMDSDCEGININPDGLLRFSHDNATLKWRDSLWSDSKLDIKNPFYEVEF